MSSEDSLETCSCHQIAMGNALPKGTTSTRGQPEFIYLLVDFPLSYRLVMGQDFPERVTYSQPLLSSPYHTYC